MKKLLFVLAIGALAACGSGANKDAAKDSTATVAPAADSAAKAAADTTKKADTAAKAAVDTSAKKK
ncbi:hypothetical protein SAMN05444410_11249 [Hydrobacter penzbergensis]|uniref:Lipoprotein n=1 Tax=Hydrobacter penzbergensis TaxID=1235997 RepID=A0A8X8LEI7_9BACT|nr:hypothetical protein [Hydrobacter penzbergensis]MBN8718097.1 hypothetical protein [Sediminibacterium magnilacihabitans]PQV61689.1 hypothetical protein CLV53_102303 [Sediminibacterium magnilacihabitans]SDX27232.1 hypothetical protein SAMN05444410_11249 [Hydrobacter penzbergensis]